MVDVRPEEISAILKQQLGGFSTATELEQVGTVLQVGDGIARIYGLNNVQAGELVEFDNGTQAIALNLEEDNVGVVLLGSSTGIQEGSKARRTSRIASLQVQSNRLSTIVKFDKLTCLNIVQAIDTSDTVTDLQYRPDLFQFSRCREATQLLFEDC